MNSKFYTELDRPKVEIVEGEQFTDNKLYTHPTLRSFKKIPWNNLTLERVRRLTDYDGEIRHKATVYWTYPVEGRASGAMVHRDVDSCLATHIIPVEEEWEPEWGGQFRFHDDEVIPDYYRNIMNHLVKPRPSDMALSQFDTIKKTGFHPPFYYELEMNANHSVIFKNSPLSWHSVAPLKTDKPRRVFIITYHKSDEKCELGD